MRGPSSRNYLRMDWEYPVYTPPVVDHGDATFAKVKRVALSREDALAYIAGDDSRPLLVLRECKVCNGTDDALLKGEGNEQTFLLARWFHCVKLPADVMEEDHPFHNLFLQEQPEHLFISTALGEDHDPLESQTSRTELWDSLRSMVAAEYKRKADSSIKKIAGLLNELDLNDTRLERLEAKRDEILEEDGPEAKKLKKLVKQIDEVKADTEDVHREIFKASELQLRMNKVRAASAEAEVEGAR